jgi:hypothetical protein
MSLQYTPLRKAKQYRALRKSPEYSCHPLVREMFAIMAQKRITLVDLCRRAGLSKKVAWYWKRAHSPRVANLEAALNVIGCKLIIVRKEDAQ